MTESRTSALILNVDDSPATRKAVTSILEKAGFRVIEVGTGADALARAGVDKPHLIVLDVELPDMLGTAVARRLKIDPATSAIPVLQISATKVTDADHTFALDAGADAYLVHPIDPGVLIATARALLRMRAAVDRVHRMHAVTAELSVAVTPAQVASIVLGHGVRALDAAAGLVALLTPDSTALEVTALWGHHGWLTAAGAADTPGARVPLHTPVPISVCAWTAEPIWIESLDAYRSSYPHLAPPDGSGPGADHAPGPPQALACIPFALDTRVVGVVAFAFSDPRSFPETERLFLSALALHGAQALERSRLFKLEQSVRKQAEDAMAALQVSLRAREDLLAIVSHDLRNPLNLIYAGASMLQQRAPEGEAGAWTGKQVTRIMTAAERMSHLIDALLDAASIESGRFTVERRPEPAAPLVAEAIEAVAPLAAAKSIDIERRLVELCVECDRQRVMQVLINLLTNAIKFTPPRGLIRVTASEQPGGIQMSVADTGPGIPAELLPKLFDRYERGSRATGGGTGLGLYIAKGIVEAHGGALEVESHPGAGSTFFFLLPRASAP